MTTQADRQQDWAIGRALEKKDAEIARLRAALEDIASKDRTGYARGALGRIARTALEIEQIT